MARCANFTIDLVAPSNAAHDYEKGRAQLFGRWSVIPGMVKRIQQSFMRPGISYWVKTFVAEMAGMDFAEERYGAKEMGVPSDRTDGEKGG